MSEPTLTPINAEICDSGGSDRTTHVTIRMTATINPRSLEAEIVGFKKISPGEFRVQGR
jgi:hypothetical protein